MNLGTHRSLRCLEKDWVRLYKITPNVSPFLSLDAIRVAIKYFFPYYIKGKKHPLICVFRKKGEIIALVPVIKPIRGKVVELFGNVNGFNECGMLHNPSVDVQECVTLLKEKFGYIKMGRIEERCSLSSLRPENARLTKNVAIEFGDSYETYFSTLSKSVRQNVRTAYNRVQKDGLSLEVAVYEGKNREIPLDEIINLYCRRHEARYGVKTSRLKKIFLRYLSFATKLYEKADNALTFCLNIDGELAGFMSGLFVRNRLIIPRLSVSDKFLRYSPGMLLVCESIKYLIANTDIRILDLSQGEEPYKYQLGGIEHMTYHFQL